MKHEKPRREMELKEIIPHMNMMSCILAMGKVGSRIMDVDISGNLENEVRIDTKDKLFRKQKRVAESEDGRS